MYNLHKAALIDDKKKLEKEINENDFRYEPKWLKEHKIQYLNDIIEQGNNAVWFDWQHHNYYWKESFLAKATKTITDKLENKVGNLEEKNSELNKELEHKTEKLETALAEILVEVKELKEKVGKLEQENKEFTAQIEQSPKKL
ncbi:protein of unknown function [endosymbiont DhMRE of Dentiscutata heterogama]|uniref:hypothetical protein n=1 Tax=endosymbiont DhMRE of Dentiscutata heterogama TaxID=1609546 RepID=UPI000629D73C|nr:hypothetical protein [endosymbiont DhMRE of Dentiscutata heterogama]CFW93393.1 protein of unknown function [endosymbiont DhMRE of Dentiscutata heterogama]